MSDAAARELIGADLDRTLLVEAAAGTGKTTELVKRILAVIAQGRARIQDIVAVTFTEKAAGELKLRLRTEIERQREATDALDVKSRLTDALQRLEEAHVNTIHGFCADLLRERPVEAQVDPHFQVLTDDQAERLYGRAFRAWLQAQLTDPPPGIRRSLCRPSRFGDENGPIERLQQAGWSLAGWRDFPGEWRTEPFERERAIDMLIAQLHALADLSENPTHRGDNFFLDTRGLRRLSDEVRRTREAGARRPRPLGGVAHRAQPRSGLQEESKGERSLVQARGEPDGAAHRPARFWRVAGALSASGRRRSRRPRAHRADVEPRALREAEGTAGRARLSRSAALRAQARARQRRRAPGISGALHPHLRR